MKRLPLIAVISLFFGLRSGASAVATLSFGAFGKVAIYHPAHVPEAFVLFISGDGGWNSGVVAIANNVVARGAMVAGIDIRNYFMSIKALKSKCYYPAGDFKEISLTIQKKYKFNQYLKPILVGYSSGATLAYGLLAQAPANTFKGAISLVFCSDIEIGRPLCKGSGLNFQVLKEDHSYYLEPSMQLTSPFIALNGTIDQICNYTDIKKYVESMPMGELITLPNVGHGFSVVKNWMPKFATAYKKVLNSPGYAEQKSAQNKLLQSQSQSLLKSDLPLMLIPSADNEGLPLAFFISGDGGWTSFDQSVCEKLAEKGIPIIGLDAQKYFWNEKTPELTADEITVAIKHYMQLWEKRSFVLLGYSFGACVAPFIAIKFNDSLKEVLKGVYSFSPDMTGDFEVHISDMLHLKTKNRYDVTDEMKQILPLNPFCIFGDEEDQGLQKEFSSLRIRIEILQGNHHYNNNYNAIADIILKDFLNTK